MGNSNVKVESINNNKYYYEQIETTFVSFMRYIGTIFGYIFDSLVNLYNPDLEASICIYFL